MCADDRRTPHRNVSEDPHDKPAGGAPNDPMLVEDTDRARTSRSDAHRPIATRRTQRSCRGPRRRSARSPRHRCDHRRTGLPRRIGQKAGAA